MNNKKGISLVALVVTIIVLSIVTTIIVINTNDVSDNAKKETFAEELRTILDATNTYYLENGNFPVAETYTKTEFISLVATEEQQLLQDEMSLNEDTSEVYYKVNLDLIRTSGGIFSGQGEKYNTFIINSDATDIYYPAGYAVGDIVYFSLSSKLVEGLSFKLPDNTSSVSQLITNVKTASITLIKDSNEWTNNLKVTVNTTTQSEQVYYTVGGVKTEITETFPYVIELSSETLTEEQIRSISTNPVLTVTKEIDGNVVARTYIGIDKLDVTAPTLTEDPVVSPRTGYNLIIFNAIEDGESDVVSSYYVTGDTTLTAEQIVARGTKGETTYINIAEEVTKVNLVLVDDAGNVSSIYVVDI